MSRIISFRGKLSDGEVETIALQTNNGLTGYQIVKFQIIPQKAVTTANESVIQIFKTQASAVPSLEIDFSNNRLLAVGIYSNQTDTTYYPDDMNIVFESEKFNQDIYITHKQGTGSGECNYYLELKQMSLDLNEQTVATLKDIRNVGAE